MTAELTHLVPLAKITSAGLRATVRATPEQCEAIAKRMGIPAVASLECRFDMTREADGVSIAARGRLRAEVTRECVVSTEEFESTVDEEFDVRFVPAGAEHDDPDPNLPDEIPYEGGAIDLGEAAAEQLALALDPYPRMPGAELPELDDDAHDSPFSVVMRRLGPDKPGH